MKKIKKIYLFGLIFSLIGFVACQDNKIDLSQDTSPEVPEGCYGVYFPKSNTAAYELEPTAETEIEITIARTVTAGDLVVPLTVEANTDDVYEVPASVTFSSGEEEATFKVTFPKAGEGKAYELKIAIEGDAYVNPYSSENPHVATKVTRIKWEVEKEQFVFVDGTFSTLFGVPVPSDPYYVTAEKAKVGTSTKYRFKNLFASHATLVDEDGILDGFPYNDPGDYDDSQDYLTIIEINDKGEITMDPHEIGVDWGYGMMSIGTIYGNLSNNKDSYPLGKKVGNSFVFPKSSLYFSMANYNDGGKYVSGKTETIFYFSKKDYIEANMKIEDFNALDYELVEGAVGQFESKAFDKDWEQVLLKAIDIDEKNKDSEYKNLYLLPNLYAEDLGLAFYNEDGKITIVENQQIGQKFLGKDIYVSQNKSVKSEVVTDDRGLDIYTFGLTFHFKDGTKLGDFTESYFYSKDALPGAEKVLGAYKMTGPSQFKDEDPADMDVEISQGATSSEFIITGIDLAAEVVASFNSLTEVMTIAPQKLADYGPYDITLYTTDLDGNVSSNLPMLFVVDGNKLVLSKESQTDGYLLRSEAAGGWVDGFYDVVFTKVDDQAGVKGNLSTRDISVKQSTKFGNQKPKASAKATNFKVSGKISYKNIIHSSNFNNI